MFCTEKASSELHLQDSLHLRHLVFVLEQHCDPAEEVDAYDSTCDHWITYEIISSSSSSSRVPIATVRLVTLSNGIGKIGRLAVRKSHRGRKLGKALMEAMEAHVREYQPELSVLMMHAQRDKIGFYEKMGYQVTDATVFYEDGIEHVKMEKMIMREVGEGRVEV